MSYPTNNPYQSPPGFQKPGFGQFQQPQSFTKLIAPGIALIVVGSIDILHGIFGVITNLVTGSRPADVPAQFQGNAELVEFMMKYGPTINIAVNLLWIVLSAIVLAGGIMMVRRQSRGLAMAAAIIATIPCTGFMDCCLIEVGFGIWSLVILFQADVQRMFR